MGLSRGSRISGWSGGRSAPARRSQPQGGLQAAGKERGNDRDGARGERRPRVPTFKVRLPQEEGEHGAADQRQDDLTDRCRAIVPGGGRIFLAGEEWAIDLLDSLDLTRFREELDAIENLPNPVVRELANPFPELRSIDRKDL